MSSNKNTCILCLQTTRKNIVITTPKSLHYKTICWFCWGYVETLAYRLGEVKIIFKKIFIYIIIYFNFFGKNNFILMIFLFLEANGFAIYDSLITWSNRSIYFNPNCSTCVYSSIGVGCNNRDLDSETLFMCTKDAVLSSAHEKACLGCHCIIEDEEEGVSIKNLKSGFEKWMCLALWGKLEMGIYIISKFFLIIMLILFKNIQIIISFLFNYFKKILKILSYFYNFLYL
jgi:hypothetical protein